MAGTVAPAPAFPGWDLAEPPFHPGELAVQQRVGVAARVADSGRRSVRRYLTAQHRDFFPLLPMAFVGTVAADGQPWASVLMGAPGFITAPDEHHLQVETSPLFGDVLNDTLLDHAPMALLGIELPTRRRNRAVGTIERVGEGAFTLSVQQTLGLCAQYIQGRQTTFTNDPRHPMPRPVHRASKLDEMAQAIITQADCFFIASNDPIKEHGIHTGPDVSHRGGKPGFVRIDGADTLTAPDFVGNFIFNTLGNITFEPRVGLLFVDFTSGDFLQIAARAEIVWDGEEVRAFAGAQRLVRFHLERVVRVENALPARFSDPDYSPVLEQTGSWEDAEASLEAARLRDTWRPFLVAAVRDESRTIRSFWLKPMDGHGVAVHRPGQFLPIRVTTDSAKPPLLRTYTISDAADGHGFRLSIKREGRGGLSDWLHEYAIEGTSIEALAPRGDFTLVDAPERPIVMISAGIGVTPMMAMLNALMVNDGRTRHHAPVHFIHAARNSAEHAFADELRAKAARHTNLLLHVIYSAPLAEDRLGETHDSEGRIDKALLQALLPLDDYEFYLCGPAPFMQSIYDLLIALGTLDRRIHFEAFGPATVGRRADEDTRTVAGPAVEVRFASSGISANWRAGDGSLLELAEKAGLKPLASCRSGVCGTCMARVLSGSVSYMQTPVHQVEAGHALVCCATPATDSDGEGVTLDL